MLFDIGPGEFLVIAVVGLLIVGPERLPKMLAEAVRWLRVLRDQAVKAGARSSPPPTSTPVSPRSCAARSATSPSCIPSA